MGSDESAKNHELTQRGSGPGALWPRHDRRFLDGSAGEPVQSLELQAGPLSLFHQGRLQPVHAGPLALLFDQGGIRYVRLGEREIIRRIYCAVRDANWGTVPDQLSNLQTNINRDSFRIQFDITNREHEIDFEWRGVITGDENGRVVFEMNGVANTTFRKNRIGFCILHPMDLAGTAVDVGHDDGSRQLTEFPQYIAAENPFQNITGLRHAVEPGVELELKFEGDIFETEDQRNWIDASFKTFCTPLSRPRPTLIQAGDRIFQRVTIDLHCQSHNGLRPLVERGYGYSIGPVFLELGTEPVGPLPKIGFNLPADAAPLTHLQLAHLRLLKPAHLRCELKLAEDIEPTLQRAIDAAVSLNISLDMALFIGEQPERELAAFVALVERVQPPVARWTVFPATGWSTTRDLAQVAAKYLRKHDPKIPLGGGTPANFRELNGQRPPVDLLDFMVWSVTPQIHAFDNASLAEALAAHVATVESARQFSVGRPLVVGPSTFKMQVNPYATGPWPSPTPAGQLPPQIDLRQLSLFGAGWTLGSIKYLAESGAHAATYYDLVGWKGLIESETGSPLPDQFPSLPGCVFPLYHVFADLVEMPDAHVLPLKSSRPLWIDGLALTNGTYTRLLLANLTGTTRTISLKSNARRARIRTLAQGHLQDAINQPQIFRSKRSLVKHLSHWNGYLNLELQPYALAQIDLT